LTSDVQPALDPITGGAADPVGKAVTTPTQPSTGLEQFAYDLADHLLSVTRSVGASEKLWYGPMGELILRQQGVDLTWYAGALATVRAKLPSACQTAGCAADQTSITVDAHVLLGTTRIASVRSRKVGTSYPVSQTLYTYRDRQGSVVATSTAGGAIGVKLRYGPYGTLDKVVGATALNGDLCPVSTTSTCPELGFTGALRLTGSLLYLNARVYDAALRRFLSADSADLKRYAYTGGHPANYTDPSGMFPIENPGAGSIRWSSINPNFLVDAGQAGGNGGGGVGESGYWTPCPDGPGGACWVFATQTVRTGSLSANTESALEREAKAQANAAFYAGGGKSRMGGSPDSTDPEFAAIYAANLRLEWTKTVTALGFLRRFGWQIAKSLAHSSPAQLFPYAPELTPSFFAGVVERDIVASIASGGEPLTNPWSVAAAEELGAGALKGAAISGTVAGAALFAQPFFVAGMDTVYQRTASDIYTVLSRGRGP
jgi:RHS repeat-associated protein